MLERATACLKPEAVRDSLRCGQQFSRSKRRLHSTFWSHGAGELDLPPWALPTFSRSADLPLKSNDTRRRDHRSERGLQTAFLRDSFAIPDSPFLEFLYPPQALAWLQRANAQHWQRWERRNARRLPDGFIVASRGYASRPQVQNLPMNTVEGQEKQWHASGMSSELGGDTQDSQESNQEELRTSAGGTHEQERANQESSESSRNGDVGKDSTIAYNPRWQIAAQSESGFADSLADIDLVAEESSNRADMGSIGNIANGLQGLLKIMRSTRSGRSTNSDDPPLKAIAIYESLEDDARSDIRLKREFLQWLSSQRSKTAESFCLKLYKQIPVGERTLETYQAMATVFQKRSMTLAVDELHKEALQNLENGHQISRTLFRWAMERRQWQLAIQVERAHHERYSAADVNDVNINKPTQIRIFWLHVSEIPMLLFRAIQLAGFLQRKDSTHIWDDHTRRFAAALLKEAISQGFLRNDGVHTLSGSTPNMALSRRHIRKLFTHISLVEDAPNLFHDVLVQMLRPDSALKYSEIHHIVSFEYAKYRGMTTFRPTEEFFMLWLKRLTEYSEKFSELKVSTTGFSISQLVQDWERHFGKVSQNGVLRLMKFYAKSTELKSYEQWLEYFRSVYPAYEDRREILWTTIWVHAKRADLDAAQRAFAEVKRATAEEGDEPDIRCWHSLLLAHLGADDLKGALTNLQNMIDYGNTRPDEYCFHAVLQMLARRGDVRGTENLLEQYDRIVGSARSTVLLSSLLLAHIKNHDLETAVKILQEAIPLVRECKIVGPLLGCFNLLLTAYAYRRDMSGTRQTYHWMRREDVKPDVASYASIMMVLSFYRRTQQAYWTLEKIMPAQGLRPTALHYDILVSGFFHNGQPGLAVQVYNRMRRANLKPSAAARSAYLKAKALLDHRRIDRQRMSNEELFAANKTVKELERVLRITDGTDAPSNQPHVGPRSRVLKLSEVPESYFDFLIFIHEQRWRSETVEALYQEYMEDAKKLGKDPDTSIRLLESVAAWCWSHGNHEDVQKCWQWAKEQADEVVPLVPVPQLKVPASDEKPDSDAIVADRATSDFVADPGTQSQERHVKNAPRDDAAGTKQVPLVEKQALSQRPKAPAHRHRLSRVLRYYILSLQSQGRAATAISTVTQLLREGYTMDIRAWNAFIQSLCQNTPPLALLAFVLAERFLTPHFPGWSTTIEYRPRREAVRQGLQYIKARYLAPGQLMLQYPTVVHMGAALIELRKSLAQGGGRPSIDLPPQLKKYVGTVELIHKHAPKTVFVVQTMPKVSDGLQTRLLSHDSL